MVLIILIISIYFGTLYNSFRNLENIGNLAYKFIAYRACSTGKSIPILKLKLLERGVNSTLFDYYFERGNRIEVQLKKLIDTIP